MPSIPVRDSAGLSAQLGVSLDAEGNISPRSTPLVNGLPVGSGNPMPTRGEAAGVGVFAGANKPALTGTTAAGTSSLAGIGPQLGGTIAPLPAGREVRWQNQSGALVALVFDDGTADPPTNYEVLLVTGMGAGLQGDGDRIERFPGRVRAYGPAGSQFMLWGR